MLRLFLCNVACAASCSNRLRLDRSSTISAVWSISLVLSATAATTLSERPSMPLATRTMIAHVSWSGEKLLGMCCEAGCFPCQFSLCILLYARQSDRPVLVGQIYEGCTKPSLLLIFSLQPSFVPRSKRPCACREDMTPVPSLQRKSGTQPKLFHLDAMEGLSHAEVLPAQRLRHQLRELQKHMGPD